MDRLHQTLTQRVGPLAGLADLLATFDVDPDRVMEPLGVTAAQLTPEARLPMATALALLERAAALTSCPHFGLLLGAGYDHRIFGVIGDMMACAPTLGTALRDYVGVQIGYSRGAIVYLQRAGDDYLLGYGVYDPAGTEGGRQIYDLVLALGANTIRSLTDRRADPLRILECCNPPDQMAPYARLLKAPISFNQEQTGFLLSGRHMDMKLPHADPEAYRRLRAAVAAMARGDLTDLAARVRHTLRPRLMLGEASREAVAHELGLGPRTLARQLAAAGTSFEAIKDEVRLVVARELLLLTGLRVGQVAEALSYATHSAFVHAFQRWMGLSPGAWRAAQKPAASGQKLPQERAGDGT